MLAACTRGEEETSTTQHRRQKSKDVPTPNRSTVCLGCDRTLRIGRPRPRPGGLPLDGVELQMPDQNTSPAVSEGPVNETRERRGIIDGPCDR